jgi:hypothetical protein
MWTSPTVLFTVIADAISPHDGHLHVEPRGFDLGRAVCS